MAIQTAGGAHHETVLWPKIQLGAETPAVKSQTVERKWHGKLAKWDFEKRKTATRKSEQKMMRKKQSPDLLSPRIGGSWTLAKI